MVVDHYHKTLFCLGLAVIRSHRRSHLSGYEMTNNNLYPVLEAACEAHAQQGLSSSTSYDQHFSSLYEDDLVVKEQQAIWDAIQRRQHEEALEAERLQQQYSEQDQTERPKKKATFEEKEHQERKRQEINYLRQPCAEEVAELLRQQCSQEREEEPRRCSLVDTKATAPTTVLTRRSGTEPLRASCTSLSPFKSSVASTASMHSISESSSLWSLSSLSLSESSCSTCSSTRSSHSLSPLSAAPSTRSSVSARRAQITRFMRSQGSRTITDTEIQHSSLGLNPPCDGGAAAMLQAPSGEQFRVIDRRRAGFKSDNKKKMVTCGGCSNHFYVSGRCKILYCPECETLTPTTFARGVAA